MPEAVPLEAQESKDLMRFLRQNAIRFTHVKNETGRSMRGRGVRNWRAVWDAVDGVSPGFPDFIVIVENQLIIIEMKRLKGSTTSLAQKQWLEAFTRAGIPARVCKGAEDAKDFVKSFMTNPPIKTTKQKTNSIF